MVAQTLPLKAGLRLDGLNAYGQGAADRIISIASTTSGPTTVIDFVIGNNSNYNVGDTITIQGLDALPNPLTTTVYSLTGTNTVSISSTNRLKYSVSYFQSYTTNGKYFIAFFIANGHTMQAGSTIKISGLASPFSALNGNTYTVTSVKSGAITIQDAGHFGISTSYFPSIEPKTTSLNISKNGLVITPPLTMIPSAGVLEVQVCNASTPGLLVATIALGPFPTSGYLSDHSRSPIQVSHEEIETTSRTVDGSLRFHHNATKRKYSVSWKDLPADSAATIDGYMGGHDLLDVYKNNKGTFYLEVYNRNKAKKSSSGPSERVHVRISSFSYDIVRRNFVINATGNLSDLWDVQISFEEV